MEIKDKRNGTLLLAADDAISDISRADLAYADLQFRNLEDTRLVGVNLSYADLRGASLVAANLADSNLTCADLRDATACKSHFAGVNLTAADLTGAAFQRVDCTEADFTNANLTDVALDGNLFIACRNLHTATGLETIKHLGPSTLDVRTLRESVLHLPSVFLRGVGYTDEEIQNLRTYLFHPLRPTRRTVAGNPR